MSSRPGRVWAVAGVLWLTGALLGSAWQFSRFVERERTRFAGDFEKAYATVAQRLDQIEALLDGLVALLRSTRDPGFPELRSYADELLRRYPQLYTIGYQPHVAGDEREAFERRMSERLGRPFRIRDFDFEGDRRWRDAPPRPYHFPVVFMAPELPDAQDVIGYDVTADTRFRAAASRSAQLDEPVATLPFDLVEGGRGYIVVRALRLHAGTLGGDSPQADHLLSPLIRADRLFSGVSAGRGEQLTLRHGEAVEPGAALLWHVGETSATAQPAGAWEPPATRLRRALPSAHQPFELEMTAQARWQDFAWGGWALWFSAWTLLVLSSSTAMLALRGARRERERAQLAEQDLLNTERRAEASRGRSLDELGSGIAHELNQPLTAIVGYSQAALRMLPSARTPSAEQLDALRETLQANAEQALRAGELMQRLRSLVRQQPVRMRTVVMQEVLADALRRERGRIERAGVAIERRLPASELVVIGDAMLLEQLIGNLLRNALEALQAPDAQPSSARRISIELDADAQRCLLVVADNGPGLSDEQRKRAFHPFQSTKPGGIGIGLALCASIVRAHGGEIAVENAQGGGARFVVTLPLRPPATDRPEPPHTP